MPWQDYLTSEEAERLGKMKDAADAYVAERRLLQRRCEARKRRAEKNQLVEDGDPNAEN